MAHSSSGGSASMSTNGTMVGVPTPGANEKFEPAAGDSKMIHGQMAKGGSQMVKPVSRSGSGEYPTHGGNQEIKSGR